MIPPMPHLNPGKSPSPGPHKPALPSPNVPIRPPPVNYPHPTPELAPPLVHPMFPLVPSLCPHPPCHPLFPLIPPSPGCPSLPCTLPILPKLPPMECKTSHKLQNHALTCKGVTPNHSSRSNSKDRTLVTPDRLRSQPAHMAFPYGESPPGRLYPRACCRGRGGWAI